MINMLSSDLYRLRHGAAARNTILGLLATIIFLGATFTLLTSDGIVMMLDEGMAMADEAEGVLSEKDQVDIAQLYEMMPGNAAEFATEVTAQNMIPMFLLPFIVVLFTTDFSTGAFRNTLSYQTNRSTVYLSKLVLGILCCVALNVITLLFSWLVGGILMGFGGFTALYLQHTMISTLLLMLSQIGVLCFGYCIGAVTRKTSTTITVYLLTLLLSSVVLQLLGLIPSMGWLTLLDWNAVGTVLVNYWQATAPELAASLAIAVVGAVVSTLIGLNRFRVADMT